VRVWNHRILLKRLSDAETRYTDEVEIHAGALTPLVWIWSMVFYRHRQHKWRTMQL
jgi:hypothetical protein